MCGYIDEKAAALRLTRGSRAQVVWHGARYLDLTSIPTGFLVTRLWAYGWHTVEAGLGGWAANQHCFDTQGHRRTRQSRPPVRHKPYRAVRVGSHDEGCARKASGT